MILFLLYPDNLPTGGLLLLVSKGMFSSSGIDLLFVLFVLFGAAGSKYVVIGGHLHVSDITLKDTLMFFRCFARHPLNLA
jgi:hypothetical protein